jgi:tripeptide aminopeptidase
MSESFIRDARRLLWELLATPGGSGQEGRVMALIVKKLRQAGTPAEAIEFDRAHLRSPHGGEIGNLVCRLAGTVRGPRRLFLAHVDTVPLAVGARPFRRGRFIVSADRSKGLGADNRAGTAVVLATAIEVLRRRLPHPPLSFLWTVQEEVGLHGSQHANFALLGRPRLAFNFDGGQTEKVTIGATGGYRMAVHVEGKAAHAGCAPEEGISAIAIAALAISNLYRHGWLGRIEKGGRSGTANVGVIRGGEATNVITPLVELRAEARSHHPTFRGEIVRQIQRAFRQAAAQVHNSLGERGRVSFSGRLDYEAFLLPDNDPSLHLAEDAIRELGGRPYRAVANGGLDANWLTARGIPTVTLGCGQLHPHTTEERLDLDEFSQACRIALRLATA